VQDVQDTVLKDSVGHHTCVLCTYGVILYDHEQLQVLAGSVACMPFPKCAGLETA
jgi:hypothetical protein